MQFGVAADGKSPSQRAKAATGAIVQCNFMDVLQERNKICAASGAPG